ncbi:MULTISPECIES: TlpA disulfide reductase family protein [unclassified Chelatococcus]|uniref:thiol:disulfide interchange protein TlpA n=1 Tax=unclassified Chelatococcus TaxID=2638111 RepID=UPI0002D3C94B|nr:MULTISPECIES: TlpA disulfide reductase family protein [unclassified Chelatococcus]ALA18017.1 thiol:disulfide interchange protein [Chelatococcus sp. CO-6]
MAETTPLIRRPLFVVAVLGAAVLGVGLALTTGRLVGGNDGATAQCEMAQATLDRLRPLAKGEVAAVKVPSTPQALPALAFDGPDGKRLTLADFKGRTVLLNLWATWCAPCRQEMPALDALEADLGGADFEVVAVNIDTRDPEKPQAWLKDAGITRLAHYRDPEAKIFQELKSAGKAFGMPTTLVVGPEGCAVAELAGPAEWHSDDAVAFIKAALGR